MSLRVGLMLFLVLEASSGLAADFQALIDATPAGHELHLPAGRYVGNFKVTRPIRIQASGDVILDGGNQGTVLEITRAPDVLISGIRIERSGDTLGTEDSAIKVSDSPRATVQNVMIQDTLFGIQLMNSPGSVIEDCAIQGRPIDTGRRGDGVKIWYSHGAKLLRTRLEQSRDVLFWYSDDTLAEDNAISDSRYGIHYMYSSRSLARNNLLKLNSVGIYVMYSHDIVMERNQVLANRGPSGFGLAFKDSDRFKAIGNSLNENRVGIYVDASPITPPANESELSLVSRNRIARNDIGISFAGTGAGDFFVQNDFIDNWQQISVRGAHENQAKWSENYWTDYAGVDPDGDGFGQHAYLTAGLAAMITDQQESFRIFSFGPAVLALEFAERAVPWLQPSTSGQDSKPAMRPWAKVLVRRDSLPFLGLGFLMTALVTVGRRMAFL